MMHTIPAQMWTDTWDCSLINQIDTSLAITIDIYYTIVYLPKSSKTYYDYLEVNEGCGMY
jgi:hypothetical protein